MRTNTQEAVLSAYIASVGKPTPRDAARDGAELCRLASSLSRFDEMACNSGLTEREERRKQNLQTRARPKRADHRETLRTLGESASGTAGGRC